MHRMFEKALLNTASSGRKSVMTGMCVPWYVPKHATHVVWSFQINDASRACVCPSTHRSEHGVTWQRLGCSPGQSRYTKETCTCTYVINQGQGRARVYRRAAVNKKHKAQKQRWPMHAYTQHLCICALSKTEMQRAKMLRSWQDSKEPTSGGISQKYIIYICENQKIPEISPTLSCPCCRYAFRRIYSSSQVCDPERSSSCEQVPPILPSCAQWCDTRTLSKCGNWFGCEGCSLYALLASRTSSSLGRNPINRPPDCCITAHVYQHWKVLFA
jgi:hypothetical protein